MTDRMRILLSEDREKWFDENIALAKRKSDEALARVIESAQRKEAEVDG